MRASTIYPSESLVEIRSQLLDDLKAGKLSREQAFSKLLENDRYDIVPLLELADLRQQSGDLEAAVGYLWKAIEAQPCYWTSYIELARILDSLGNAPLRNGLAELGLRKMRLDPDGVEAFGNAPFPGEDTDSEDAEDPDELDGEEDLEDEEDLEEVEDLEVESPLERLESTIDLLRDRRDLEPLDVTARLRPTRLIDQIHQTDDLDEETVDALVREGEAFVPWLTGVLRSYVLNPLFEYESRMAENTLALLGEIGSPDALPPLLEFCTSQDYDVAGAAGWAVGRILELQPERAIALLHELAPGFDVYTRIAVADVLLGRPSIPHAETLLERLAESASGLPTGQHALLFPVIMTALVAIRGRVGRELARKLLRRNASFLDRHTRRECTELLEAADQLVGDPEPLDRPHWTVYEICAGEVIWPTGEEDEDDEDDEPGQLKLVTPVKRAPSPGRNDPCPCGSGKKYKKCHLDADAPF
ncbi:MAG: hypothetical protein QOJ99_4268 [Bryobacterales bacterium]|jgi:tetratricopeptide (TPR) repeat protein|nr:hypothetical protein [Bryobacterales bacterium]